MKRKITKLLMGGMMSIALLTAASQSVHATENVGQETITKEQYAASQADIENYGVQLQLNQMTEGVLSEKSEEDYYKFDITQSGYFQVQLNVSAAADVDAIGWGWDLTIYKKGDMTNPIKKYASIKSSCLSACLPMESGRYYAVVEANYTNGAPVDCPYEITAKFTASDAWEVEGNDSNTTYNTIAVNKDYQGTLYNGADVDWYRVDTAVDGTLQVNFGNDEKNDPDAIGWGWDIQLFDKDFKQLKKYTAVKSDMISQFLPFQKGTFYVKVSANYIGSAPTDCIYHLNIKSAQSSSWESEYNDTKTTADTISPNKTYSGLLYYAGDADWYKVKTTEKGYFQIQLDTAAEDAGWGWDVTVMDSNAKAIKAYTQIKTKTITPVLPYAKGTYYIKVNANYTGAAPVDAIYKLKVKQVKSSSWESEGNDTLKKADSISLNKKYKGIFTDSTDVDWYKADVSAKGVLQVKLKRDSGEEADAAGWGWDVTVYKNSNGNEAAKLKGVKNTDSVKLDVTKGTYYIKVSANYTGSAPTQCVYNLTANYSKTPAKAAISSVTAGKKKATVKWKKVSKASGYYVYRSTSKNGKYKKVATIKKGSTVKYVDKKLKSNKKYYYKVKAYTTTSGVKAEGSFSKVKSVKVK